MYNPLYKPHKEFVPPKDFKGFNQDRIKQIREMRKNQTIRIDWSLTRDSDELKDTLKARLKKMGFTTNDLRGRKGDKKGQEHLAFARLARRTGIRVENLTGYFNHNRYIWNEANGKYMKYISETQLLILCLFAGIKLSLKIEREPLEYEIKT